MSAEVYVAVLTFFKSEALKIGFPHGAPLFLLMYK
jgi:hypothetical protein